MGRRSWPPGTCWAKPLARESLSSRSVPKSATKSMHARWTRSPASSSRAWTPRPTTCCPRTVRASGTHGSRAAPQWRRRLCRLGWLAKAHAHRSRASQPTNTQRSTRTWSAPSRRSMPPPPSRLACTVPRTVRALPRWTPGRARVCALCAVVRHGNANAAARQLACMSVGVPAQSSRRPSWKRCRTKASSPSRKRSWTNGSSRESMLPQEGSAPAALWGVADPTLERRAGHPGPDARAIIPRMQVPELHSRALARSAGKAQAQPRPAASAALRALLVQVCFRVRRSVGAQRAHGVCLSSACARPPPPPLVFCTGSLEWARST